MCEGEQEQEEIYMMGRENDEEEEMVRRCKSSDYATMI